MKPVISYNSFSKLSEFYRVNPRTFTKMIEKLLLGIRFCEAKQRSLTYKEIKSIIDHLGIPDQFTEINYFDNRNTQSLAKLYNVSRATMRKWIKEAELYDNAYGKKILSPNELKKLIEFIGIPV